MRSSRNPTLAVSLLALATTMLSSVASAQDTSPKATEASDDETIVITGSRIPRRPDFESANPVVSVDADTLQESGTTNVTDFLTGYPALVGSSTSRQNAGDKAGIGTTGLNLLNLRNLGVSRTLVLVDGRRHIAGIQGDQAVDVNTIPTDLIERIDVLTGGVSAIYGADAVTGVVNFILKKNFEGISLRGQAGISEFGDAGQRLVAFTAGTNFADGRGNIAFAFEYGMDDRLESRDRKQLRGTNFTRFAPNPGAGPDRVPLQDLRFFDTNREGGIDLDFNGFPDVFVGANGQLVPFNGGTIVGAGLQVGGNATPIVDYANDLRPEVQRYVGNFLGHYDFSDHLTLYGEAKFARVDSFSLQQPTFDYYLFIEPNNPFIPAALKPTIASNGGALLNRDNFDFGQRGEDIRRETIRTVLGLKGDLADNLHFDVSYVFGQTKIRNHYVNDIFDDRFYAALDVVQGPNGPTCRANLDPNWFPFQPFVSFFSDPPIRQLFPRTTFAQGSCVPLNLFGENAASQQALDFITTDSVDRSKLQQHVVTAVLTGELGAFSLPGGNIGFALGAEYRKEKSLFEPDPNVAAGLTYSNVLSRAPGSFDVKEVFAEVRIPILKEQPWADRLELGAAARFSDYSTVGSTWTWKVDATYAPVPDITFAGTYSRAVRAPNIGELFAGASQTFEFIDDPCDADNLGNGTSFRTANCATLLSGLGVPAPGAFQDNRSANISGLLGGNSNLGEETATTWTAGVTLAPRFIPGLTVRGDWYDIKLRNAINFVTPQEAADLCVDQPSLTNPFCPLITRSNAGATRGLIVDFDIIPQNVAQFRTAGFDLNLNYRFEVQSIGRFNLNLVGNYLDRLEFVGTPGAPTTNGRGEGFAPKYQATFDLNFKTGSLTLNYGLSWFDNTLRFTNQLLESNPNFVAPEFVKIKERWVHDIFASVDVDDRFQLYGGVNNVFGQRPDYISGGTQNLRTDDYPVSAVGRFFYMGAKVNFRPGS